MQLGHISALSDNFKMHL